MTAYRRKPTIRLPEFDYSSDGLYFVTTCVHDRVCHFGRVVDDQMQLNAFGEIVQRQWFWLLERYPYLESHAFQVMPNHVHAVLEINRRLIAEKNLKIAENQDSSTCRRDRSRPVPTAGWNAVRRIAIVRTADQN